MPAGPEKGPWGGTMSQEDSLEDPLAPDAQVSAWDKLIKDDEPEEGVIELGEEDRFPSIVGSGGGESEQDEYAGTAEEEDIEDDIDAEIEGERIVAFT